MFRGTVKCGGGEFSWTLVGGVAAWPLAGGRAAEPSAKRRVGVLMELAADGCGKRKIELPAFEQGLQQSGLGRTGRQPANRLSPWPWGNTEVTRKYRRPKFDSTLPTRDVHFLASGGTVVGPLLQATRKRAHRVHGRTPDPGRRRLRLEPGARPGGNGHPGLPPAEYGHQAGNGWSCSRRFAPGVDTSGGYFAIPSIPPGIGQFTSIQSRGRRRSE